jgi:Aldo/keto reductase family
LSSGADYFGSTVNVDLYWLHHDAPRYPVEEILQGLESFQQAGKIRCAGLANWTQAREEEACLGGQRLGVQGFVASQNLWSLGKVDLSKVDPTWAYIHEHFFRRHMEHSLVHFHTGPRPTATVAGLEQGTLDSLDVRMRALFNHQKNRDCCNGSAASILYE